MNQTSNLNRYIIMRRSCNISKNRLTDATQYFFRSHQRVFDASRMGKVFDTRTRHIRHRFIHRMPNRHVSPDTELEVSERGPVEWVQRHCIELVHGTG